MQPHQHRPHTEAPVHTVAFVTTLLLLPAGCTDSDQSGAVPPAAQALTRPGLAVVPVPDIAGLAGEVRGELEGRLAQIRDLGQRPGPPAASSLGERYGELGELLEAYAFHDAAMVAYENAVRLEPQDYRWPYFLAHSHRRKGDLAGTISLFRTALALMEQAPNPSGGTGRAAGPTMPPPNRPTDLRQQRCAGLVWLGEALLEAELPQEAQSAFEEATRLRPASAAAWFGLGRTLEAGGMPNAAADAYEFARERDAGSGSIAYRLGQLYRRLGRLEQARTLMASVGAQPRRVVPRDPLLEGVAAMVSNAEAIARRGNRAATGGDWNTALLLYRRALEIAPRAAAIRVNLGLALEKLGRPRDALQEYRQAVADDPRLSHAHLFLARSLRHMGRRDVAFTHFEQAAALAPEDKEIAVEYAMALLQAGRTDAALEKYEQILRRFPADETALVGRALVLRELGRDRDALRALEAVLRLHPDSLPARHALARLLLTTTDKGIADVDRGCRIARAVAREHRSFRYVETLALADARQGDLDGAMRLQAEAVKLARSQGRATTRLEEILERYREAARPRASEPAVRNR